MTKNKKSSVNDSDSQGSLPKLNLLAAQELKIALESAAHSLTRFAAALSKTIEKYSKSQEVNND